VTELRRGASGARDVAWLVGALLLPAPWLLAAANGGLGFVAEVVAPLSGIAILGAAFLLTWACELGERDLPQSAALLVLGLVSVLPEYAVDLHFAIEAASDPAYAHYAVANMTGANRLLIGIGWTAVVLLACRRAGTRRLEIPRHNVIEIRFLLLATHYSFAIPLSGTINLFDAAILLGLFGWYAVSAARGPSHAPDLLGPPAWIDARVGGRGRRIVASALVVYAGLAIFLSAEPFAEALVEIGHALPVDEFLLVQWVAPLASESPEFVIALLFAWRHRGSVGLAALMSSKVNQWTLLVGALPVAFAAASGGLAGLPLDRRQSEELLLTSAQSLLATILVSSFGLSRAEALMLASLFVVQLVFPSSAVRLGMALLFLAICAWLLVSSAERRAALRAVLRPRAEGGIA
jgi:cation:H+ antiporter